jgi:hypothetical protein
MWWVLQYYLSVSHLCAVTYVWSWSLWRQASCPDSTHNYWESEAITVKLTRVKLDSPPYAHLLARETLGKTVTLLSDYAELPQNHKTQDTFPTWPGMAFERTCLDRFLSLSHTHALTHCWICQLSEYARVRKRYEWSLRLLRPVGPASDDRQ